ncbi:MAG: NAD-dependent epimerase/dehydratase family protein [Ignavibacteria bacterium]|nr:NAD-dependent epimerase/dehydratase family protein [Ignavibacteria bacterium]
MQTILGAGGVIGIELAKTLPEYTDKVRLAGRNPRAVNGDEELVKCDLTNYEQTLSAVEKSDIVYLTAGLEYKYDVWKEYWPKIMDNVIVSCRKHRAKLVFFDNVYMYGKVEGWMTENTPVNPVSRKGVIRAEIADALMKETTRGNLRALIARSADFYGPGAGNTFLKMLVFDKLKEKEKASWLGNAEVFHSFTYTPDAGKATALLGNTPDAYNQVWHLPTHRNAMSGHEVIEFAAHLLDAEPKYRVITKWMARMAGLFNPLVKEMVEMMYQYESDYLFDSTKFENVFFKPVSYEEGIEKCVKR